MEYNSYDNTSMHNITQDTFCRPMTISNACKTLSTRQENALSIISIVTAGISFLGSGSVIFCSIYYRRMCYPEIFPTFQLSVADFLSSLFLIISSSIFLSNGTTSQGSLGPCGYIMAFVTSFYTIAFFLTITYALEALLRFRKRLREGFTPDSLSLRVVSSKWMYFAYFLAWAVPLSLAIAFIVGTHSLEVRGVSPEICRQCSSCFADFRFSDNECWDADVIDGNGIKWHQMSRLIFLIPLIMVMVCNMLLYFLVGRVFKQVAMRRGLLSYHQRQEESVLKRKAFLYQAVFFVCWTPSVILGILSFTDAYSMSSDYWLLLIQVLLGPLQGFLNCVLYGWRRERFRQALSERSVLLSTDRGAMSVTL